MATEIKNTSGLCLFSDFAMPPDAIPRYIAAVTGWDFKEEDVIKTGMRIFSMRYAFNLREGQKATDDVVPKRSVGEPPLKERPLAGITVDYKNLSEQFFENLEWDKKSLKPTRELLKKLGGMEDIIKDICS